MNDNSIKLDIGSFLFLVGLFLFIGFSFWISSMSDEALGVKSCQVFLYLLFVFGLAYYFNNEGKADEGEILLNFLVIGLYLLLFYLSFYSHISLISFSLLIVLLLWFLISRQTATESHLMFALVFTANAWSLISVLIIANYLEILPPLLMSSGKALDFIRLNDYRLVFNILSPIVIIGLSIYQSIKRKIILKLRQIDYLDFEVKSSNNLLTILMHGLARLIIIIVNSIFITLIYTWLFGLIVWVADIFLRFLLQLGENIILLIKKMWKTTLVFLSFLLLLFFFFGLRYWADILFKYLHGSESLIKENIIYSSMIAVLFFLIKILFNILFRVLQNKTFKPLTIATQVRVLLSESFASSIFPILLVLIFSWLTGWVLFCLNKIYFIELEGFYNLGAFTKTFSYIFIVFVVVFGLILLFKKISIFKKSEENLDSKSLYFESDDEIIGEMEYVFTEGWMYFLAFFVILLLVYFIF